MRRALPIIPDPWEQVAEEFDQRFGRTALNPSDHRALWFAFAAPAAARRHPERWAAVASLLAARQEQPALARSRPLLRRWAEILAEPSPSAREASILALDPAGQQLRSSAPLTPLFGPGERPRVHAIYRQRLRGREASIAPASGALHAAGLRA